MIKTAFELKTIGKILAEKRKEKNLSYEQISEIIKINPEYLQALEEADYDRFPSEVYVKGFLKNYARFLGIDTERTLALYRREKEKRMQKPEIKKNKKIKHSSFDFSFSIGKLVAVIAVVLVGATLFYVGNYVFDIFRSPSLALSDPLLLNAGESGTITLNSDSVQLKGSAEIGSKLTINGQEYRVNSFEQFVVDFRLEVGSNPITLKAENSLGKASEITLTVLTESVATSPTVTPTGGLEPVSTIDAKIEIIASGAYLEVEIDGELAAAKAYPVDELVTFQAKNEFMLFAPRKETINLFINDELQTLDSSRVKFILSEGRVSKVNL